MLYRNMEARSFYRALDTLATYVNDQLHVVERLKYRDGTVDDYARYEVCCALWDGEQHRGLIADFVRENPYRLPAGELREVARWERALFGSFFVAQRGRDVYFLHGEHAIAVRGITMEISDMIDDGLPALVRTALVPYAGAVTYVVTFEELPIERYGAFSASVEALLDLALENGLVIRTASKFFEMVPQLIDEQAKRDAARFVHELELDMNADEQGEHMHRGVLAGLSASARQEAIEAHYRAEAGDYDPTLYLQALRKTCLRGTPVRTLDEIFTRVTNADLREMAYAAGVRGSVSTMNKRQLLEAIQPLMPTGAEAYRLRMAMVGPGALRDVRAVIEAGGTKAISDGDVVRHDLVLRSIFPVLVMFHEGNSFVAVVPDEVMAALRDFDWDGEIARAQRIDQALRFFNAATDLRGVTYLEETIGEYLGRGSTLEPEDVDDLLHMLIFDDINNPDGCVLVAVGDDPALMCAQLADVIYQEYGYASEAMTSSLARSVLGEQEGKPVRHVPDELLEKGDVAEWVLGFPEAQALVAYLDEHVPDGADDYGFAEDVTYEIVTLSRDVSRPDDIIRHLDEQYGFVPTEAQLRRLMQLVMSLANATPKWTNNGWSANELSSLTQGHR